MTDARNTFCWLNSQWLGTLCPRRDFTTDLKNWSGTTTPSPDFCFALSLIGIYVYMHMNIHETYCVWQCRWIIEKDCLPMRSWTSHGCNASWVWARWSRSTWRASAAQDISCRCGSYWNGEQIYVYNSNNNDGEFSCTLCSTGYCSVRWISFPRRIIYFFFSKARFYLVVEREKNSGLARESPPI